MQGTTVKKKTFICVRAHEASKATFEWVERIFLILEVPPSNQSPCNIYPDTLGPLACLSREKQMPKFATKYASTLHSTFLSITSSLVL